MGYIHAEITTAQSSKKPGSVCGDVLLCERTASSTTIIFADGMGSGIKAHVAATMTAHRIRVLLNRGFSLREAFGRLVDTMKQAKTGDAPYAAFQVVRILNDGEATILTYEMPAPILISGRHATALPQRTVFFDKEMVGESNCYVEPGDGLLIMSDGITQAGIGQLLRYGWGTEGVTEYANTLLKSTSSDQIPMMVHRQALGYWGTVAGDDCTVAVIQCRHGKPLNILTGPPKDTRQDNATVDRFMGFEGKHAVCGATTSKIVAKRLGRELAMASYQSYVAPPGYHIDGIDLVTEGAVTLTMAYNILDEEEDRYEKESGVSHLCRMMLEADRIHFIVGRARNPGHGDISFSQKGILPREKVVALLREKLKAMGKLVIVEEL